MSQALYRKYRSRSLDEIVGQEHITSLLKAAISADSVHHAYLLTGPRGTGKTSVARIIAHAINDLEYSDTTHLDIIEIDAASNNGIEDVRDLRERVHIAPTSAKRKVYIIDEVHMLSKQAFNALLKTLEEPPAHAVFILATTDVDKVPATIISRVHRFNFRTIDQSAVASHLRTIADSEGIKIDDAALELIASRGGGSFRDSIGMLDQIGSLGIDQIITAEQITASLGIASQQQIDDLIQITENGTPSEIKEQLDQLLNAGVAPHIIAEQLINRLSGELIDQPGSLGLIDRLLAVSSSSLPASKLLVALATKPTNKHQAKQQPVPTTEELPKSKPAKVDKTTKKPKKTEPATESAKKEPVKSHQNSSSALSSDDYRHSDLIDSVAEVPIASVLNKSGSKLDGSTITLYTGSTLFAKQLESASRRKVLMAALDSLGHGDKTLVISADKPPITDSQTAAVAAIMGGGEEVEL